MRSFRELRVALVIVAAIGALVIPQLAESQDTGPQNKILARALSTLSAQPTQQRVAAVRKEIPLSFGVESALLARYVLPETARAGISGMTGSGGAGGSVPPSGTSTGCPKVFQGSVPNVRVNQDCSLRRQAEEWVGVNPRDFNNVLAGQNDSLIGFNHCGYDWSLDRGKSWGSTGTAPPPFWQELLADGHTSDACSDPSGTFDHLGNAYVTGVFFDVVSPASAIFVAKSNAPLKGRFYHVPRSMIGGNPDPFQQYRTTPMGRPASDNDPDIFHDKELMQADSRPDSPKKGRVYVTWTRFRVLPAFPFQISPIVFSQSLDGGATWSRQVVISGVAGALCTDFSATSGACDQDQGSHPVVGPDGTIYVIFGNGNTPDPGINQVLLVRCPATKNCDSEADWEGPFRVGALIGTHPIGPAAAGCPPGRQCLPPNGYRAPEFTTMTVSVDRNSNLYATWADHRNNTNPQCDFRTSPVGNGFPPCDHDVFYAFSTNRGTTWSPTVTVTPRSRLGENAQWQPWSDVAGDGSRVYVAFYDRHYGNCETTGCNDITLATITRPRSSNRRIAYRRITTASMPNLTPANNPVQAGFLGDYMWVEVSRHSFNQRDVHIVWADTRPLFGPFPEEDIYYARIGAGDDDDDD